MNAWKFNVKDNFDTLSLKTGHTSRQSHHWHFNIHVYDASIYPCLIACDRCVFKTCSDVELFICRT